MAPARTRAATSVVLPAMLRPGSTIARPSTATTPACTNASPGASRAMVVRIALSSAWSAPGAEPDEWIGASPASLPDSASSFAPVSVATVSRPTSQVIENRPAAIVPSGRAAAPGGSSARTSSSRSGSAQHPEPQGWRTSTSMPTP